MSEKAERLYNGITNINEDLIAEVQAYVTYHSCRRQSQVLSLNMVRKKKFILAIAALIGLMIIIPIVMNGINMDKEENKLNAGENVNTNLKLGYGSGDRLEYLNAEEIKELVDYSRYDWIVSEIQKDAKYEEIYQYIQEQMKDDAWASKRFLSDVTLLSVSTYNMPVVALNSIDAPSGPTYVMKFLFENEHLVGNISYCMAEEKLYYSVSMRTTDSARDCYFDFLSEHQNQSFIILADGHRIYFLSDENVLYNAVTGSIVKDIAIEGDCYHAFDYEKVSVSYEKIMNQIERMKR